MRYGISRNTILKVALTAVILAVALVLSVQSAHACTAIYVGSEASEDGTVVIARSNDHQSVWPTYISVVERVENEPGRKMPLDVKGTIMVDIPATTYKYICTPWMDSGRAEKGQQHDAAVAVNEYGVSMTMSVTSFSNNKALKADPLVETGIAEDTINDLVICQSATAEEAVKLLLDYIDEYGSSEINVALIADQKDAWYVEMYTGHQYAAVKLPADAVCVFGNEFSLEYLSAYDKIMFSKDIFRLPKEKGFGVYADSGEIDLFGSYSGEEILSDYSHMRTWIGHQILAGGYKTYEPTARYPLCFKAKGKVSMQDVLNLLRNRYEGTEYSPDETGRTDMRVIGTDTALSVHAVQIYPDLPAEMSCVLWECLAPDVCGVFVPVSNLCSCVNESYAKNQPAEGEHDFDDKEYPWYTFKELTTLGLTKFSVYGKPVQDFWKKAEKGMISGMKQVLKKASGMDIRDAEEYITSYCTGMQEQAFEDAKQILNDVRWYMNYNSNTLKNGRDPETHRVLDELVPIDPVEIKCDSSVYAAVPEPVLVTGTVESLNEFGDAILSVTKDEFAAAGFHFGDAVTIRTEKNTLQDIPYLNGYFGGRGVTLVVGYPSNTNIVLSTMFIGFADYQGIKVGDTVSIMQSQKDKYAEQLQIVDLEYSDRIEEYPDRNTYINARSICMGNIPEGRLFRSASPSDDTRGRMEDAADFAKENGIRTILNLSQEEDDLKKAQDVLPEWTKERLDNGDIIAHKYNADYQGEKFMKQLGRDLAEMTTQEGPYLIHCREGKDRTGFVCVVLEALCDARFTEIKEDYLMTFRNYYGMDPEDEIMTALYQSMLLPMMQFLAGEEDEMTIATADLKQAATGYLTDCGMTEQEIRNLYTALTKQ